LNYKSKTSIFYYSRMTAVILEMHLQIQGI
jgi:hypothetical protein